MSNAQQSRYAKTHEWLHLEGDTATVGISDHAQTEITELSVVSGICGRAPFQIPVRQVSPLVRSGRCQLMPNCSCESSSGREISNANRPIAKTISALGTRDENWNTSTIAAHTMPRPMLSQPNQISVPAIMLNPPVRSLRPSAS